MATSTHEEQLYKIFNNVNDWLKFAEAKNFGLLTLNAAVIFGFSQTNFDEHSVIRTAGFYVFSPFALFSFLVCILSLFPILSQIEKGTNIKDWISKVSNWIDTETRFENIHFYGYLRTIEVAEFETKFLAKTVQTVAFNEYETELAKQILYNSRITWLKYQLFKIGAFLFFIGTIIFIIALPVFKYFS